MPFGGRKAKIGTFLLGAVGAAFLGRIVLGFAGAFGAIGLLVAGLLIYRAAKGSGAGAEILRFTGVALGVIGVGGFLGLP